MRKQLPFAAQALIRSLDRDEIERRIDEADLFEHCTIEDHEGDLLLVRIQDEEQAAEVLQELCDTDAEATQEALHADDEVRP